MGTITWKESRKKMMRNYYAKYVPEFEGFQDDRKVYCNTYRMIMEALEELPEEPKIFTKCAMNQKLNEDMCMMDRILLHFTNGDDIVPKA